MPVDPMGGGTVANKLEEGDERMLGRAHFSLG